MVGFGGRVIVLPVFMIWLLKLLPPLLSKVTVAVAGELVAGNFAVTTSELALLLTVAAPDTVKKLAATPWNVYPVFAVSVMVAEYCVAPEKPE